MAMSQNEFLLGAVTFLALLSLCHAQETKFIEYQLTEEQQPLTLVGDIVKDAQLYTFYDAETITSFHFHLLTRTDTLLGSYFLIEETTGLLRTSKVIDRDRICSKHSECVVKLDVAIKPVRYFQVIKVTVNIVDINDNRPIFDEESVSLAVSESVLVGASYPLPHALDEDSTIFGVQRYILRPNGSDDHFKLQVANDTKGSGDLRLILKKRLDRETEAFHSLTVVAFDGGNPAKSGRLNIQIRVLDSNDNNPRFTNETYEVYIYENLSVDTIVSQVKAVDADSGVNAYVKYRFSRSTMVAYNNLFHIDNTTGVIHVKSLIDREVKDTYTLDIVAEDNGVDPLAAYARVIVHVRDINDHAPEITVNALTSSGHAQVPEDAPVGTFVAHIAVSDPDDGVNGEFLCLLESTHFELQSLYTGEYKVVTSQMFDLKVQSEYHLNLVCTDEGELPQVGTKHIAVTVLDVNDHCPEFSQDIYLATVWENEELQSHVTRIDATDADGGANGMVRFAVYPRGHEGNLVVINPTSGVIQTNYVFDHEREQTYEFLVVASDLGDPACSSTATLSLSIADVNDEHPVFARRSYEFGTFENQPLGTEIGTVVAYDKDSAPFNKITYSFEENMGTSDMFRVDPDTGRITSSVFLDTEVRSTYSLVLLAANPNSEATLAGSTHILIRVVDRNDNAPIVDFPVIQNHTFEIESVTVVGHTITTIKAHDPDMGLNAVLQYSIADGNEEETFIINPHSGALSINKDLTSYGDWLFSLTVLVQDSGSPQLSNSVNVNIFVSGPLTRSSVHSGPTSDNYNLVLVVCITVVTLLFVIIALVVIVILRRRWRLIHLVNRHKYNCRIEASRALAANVDVDRSPKVNSEIETPRQKDRNGSYSAGDNAGFSAAPKLSGHLDQRSFENPATNGTFQNALASHPATPPPLPPHARRSLSPHRHCKPHSPPSAATCQHNGAYPKAQLHVLEDPRRRLLYSLTQEGAVTPLTEMQLQVHNMVQLAEPDHNSDRGSLTDSGRGPSEEGEGHHVTFDPDMPRRISPKKVVTFCLPDAELEPFPQPDNPRTCVAERRLLKSDGVSHSEPYCMLGYSGSDPGSPCSSLQCVNDIISMNIQQCVDANERTNVPTICGISDRYCTDMRRGEDEIFKKDDDCSTDCVSDDDTTTSGSYVVDLNDVAEVVGMYGHDTMV